MLADGPMIDAHRVLLASEDDFDGWRDAARGLAEAGVPPSAIVWEVSRRRRPICSAGQATPPPSGPSFAVPRAFVDLAKAAICHSDPERFALLYALLLKLRSNKKALEDRADPLVDRLEKLAKEVRRDAHKMHAFVRFREVEDEWRHALRRLVRARPPYRPARGGILHAPLRQHALVDPDARVVHSLGRRDADRPVPARPAAMRPTAIRSRRRGRLITPASSTRRGSR